MCFQQLLSALIGTLGLHTHHLAALSHMGFGTFVLVKGEEESRWGEGTRDGTGILRPALRAQNLNHWTTREAPAS